MPVASMIELLDAGVHFGHQTQRWNPKMKPYIYGARNGIYILDLRKTTEQLDSAYAMVRDCAAKGKNVVFVGTKKQAADVVAEEATRVGAYYVNRRWLGGMMTNYETIRTRIKKLIEIEEFMGWYDQLKGMKFASLRYFNAAGYDVEGEITGLEQKPENLLPRVMEAALGQRTLKIFGTDYDTRDGTCIRDYVHVSDLAKAHVQALEYITKHAESIKLNLGTEKGTTVKEIIEAARKITGKPIPAEEAPRRPGDPASLYTTSALAKQLIGWVPEFSDVDTLVSSTWNVYKKHFGIN